MKSSSPPQAGDKPSNKYRRDFANLCAAAVKHATGAKIVMGVPTSVQIRRSVGVMEEAPISVIHTDFTPSAALKRIRQGMQLVNYDGPVKRFAAFNTW